MYRVLPISILCCGHNTGALQMAGPVILICSISFGKGTSSCSAVLVAASMRKMLGLWSCPSRQNTHTTARVHTQRERFSPKKQGTEQSETNDLHSKTIAVIVKNNHRRARKAGEQDATCRHREIRTKLKRRGTAQKQNTPPRTIAHTHKQASKHVHGCTMCFCLGVVLGRGQPPDCKTLRRWCVVLAMRIERRHLGRHRTDSISTTNQ